MPFSSIKVGLTSLLLALTQVACEKGFQTTSSNGFSDLSSQEASSDPDLIAIKKSGVHMIFLSSAQQVAVDSCSAPVSLQLLDSSGAPLQLQKSMALSLTASSPSTLQFFSDSNCKSIVSISTLDGPSAAASFHFKGNAAGAVNITADLLGTISVGQIESITAGAPPGGSQPPPTVTTHTGRYNINGKNNLIIDGDSFTSASDVCISISNSSNITLKNISAINCYGVGVSISNSSNITIQNSYFENLNGGVYALTSSGIKVINNRFKNVARSGKMDNSRGQFVQFNNVSGGGNQISSNRGVNIPGQSTPEDLINLYMTNGTAISPVMIDGNCFSGGGPSTSGGGIMTGDEGGSYVTVQNNTLVNPGQYGIAVAGGTNIQILNNKVYGQKQSFTNIGMYVWNQYSHACSSITVQGNQVDFTNSAGTKNGFWDGGNCGTIAGVDSNNNWTANLNTLSCSID